MKKSKVSGNDTSSNLLPIMQELPRTFSVLSFFFSLILLSPMFPNPLASYSHSPYFPLAFHHPIFDPSIADSLGYLCLILLGNFYRLSHLHLSILAFGNLFVGLLSLGFSVNAPFNDLRVAEPHWMTLTKIVVCLGLYMAYFFSWIYGSCWQIQGKRSQNVNGNEGILGAKDLRQVLPTSSTPNTTWKVIVFAVLIWTMVICIPEVVHLLLMRKPSPNITQIYLMGCFTLPPIAVANRFNAFLENQPDGKSYSWGDFQMLLKVLYFNKFSPIWDKVVTLVPFFCVALAQLSRWIFPVWTLNSGMFWCPILYQMAWILAADIVQSFHKRQSLK